MSYKNFALLLYFKNCKERQAYGEQPFPDFETYEQQNKQFINDAYKEYDSE
tara:strand:+ start:373 stop:525 length:153 start_codon:yes stop_codon:yes gene_type:complete